MARAWPLQLRFALRADDAMEGLIGHLQGKLLAEPLPDRHVAGKARGRRKTRLELGEDGRGQGLLPGGGSWLFIGSERLEAPVPILAEPTRNRIAVDGEMGRRLATRGNLPGFEQDQHMQAWPQLGIALTA
jgi:hypothetical protein